MRCSVCGEQVALAKRCPYCGHEVSQEEARAAEDKTSEEPQRTRGTFRGRADREDFGTYRSDSKKITPSLTNVLKFLTSPQIPFGSKLVVFGALFYILSPVDLIPGAVLPVIGWMDDLAVMFMAWKWIRNQLSQL